jgi:uncharacterized damage-inducible protein DinB
MRWRAFIATGILFLPSRSPSSRHRVKGEGRRYPAGLPFTFQNLFIARGHTMITDIASYLRFFGSGSGRTERDIAALPSEAAVWRPLDGKRETDWTIGDIVGHIGSARLYFASAYRGEGWIVISPELDRNDARTWIPWLQSSAERFSDLLRDTPSAWLTRKIEMIDTPGSLSGWRILMMMLEHEVHHRSQVDTYAGLEDWPVPDIFERSAETISALQPAQRAKVAARARRPQQS